MRSRWVLAGLVVLLSVACGQEELDNTREALQERTQELAATEEDLQEAEAELDREIERRQTLNDYVRDLRTLADQLQDRIKALEARIEQLTSDGNGDDNGCDPSYPTVCIPPYPPDLDCPQVSPTNFAVNPPDPHGFDGYDNDGVGCET